MNNRPNLEQAFPGEPPLGIDLEQLVIVGSRRVRRRRNAAVIGAASVAVAIVVGTSILVPRLRDSPAAGGIPGCATVLGPTNSNGAQAVLTSASDNAPSSVSTSGSTSGSPAANTSTSTPPLPVTREQTSAPLDALPAPAESATQGSAVEAGSSSTTTELTLDPAVAPEAMTASIWGQLSSLGATARTNTQLGIPTFLTGEIRDPNELGWQLRFDAFLDSPLGVGDFGLYIAYDGQVAPPCHQGELDRRVTYPDGTVVDLTSGSRRADTIDSAGATTSTMNNQVHAVAYHPDGTTIIAMSSDSLNFAGSIGIASGSTPVSLTFVQEVAADPNYRRSGPYAAQVIETSGKAPVPNVVGLSQEAAATALDGAYFQIDPQTQTSEVTDPALVGRVIAQSPAGGEVVVQFGQVQVTIGVSVPMATSTEAATADETTAVSMDPPVGPRETASTG